jgi:hypothetical protein
VGVPLYKLWRVRLPTRQRRLILGGFAASLVPALGIVVSTVFQLAPSSWEPGRTDGRLKVNYMLVRVSLPSLSISSLPIANLLRHGMLICLFILSRPQYV